jgi:hypothetical protein
MMLSPAPPSIRTFVTVILAIVRSKTSGYRPAFPTLVHWSSLKNWIGYCDQLRYLGVAGSVAMMVQRASLSWCLLLEPRTPKKITATVPFDFWNPLSSGLSSSSSGYLLSCLRCCPFLYICRGRCGNLQLYDFLEGAIYNAYFQCLQTT